MRHVYSFVLVFLLLAPAVLAQTQGTCTDVGTATKDLAINNVRARLYNNGGLFWKGAGNVYNVPRVDEGQPLTPNAIFAAGIWIGGKIDGNVRLAATAYGPWEFWPGPLNATGDPDDATCSNARYDRIYTVSRADILRALQGGPTAATPDLRDWPTGLGAPTLTPAASDGIDNDSDGTTDEAGEMARVDVMSLPLDQRKSRIIDLRGGERPDLVGDQMAWWIMNDAGGTHGSTGSAPIGLEVHVTAYAYFAAGALDNTTFYRYRMFKRGEGDLTDAYLSYWTDPDLGNASDDYVGTDTTLDMIYVYNGDNEDEGSDGYGTAPPALGISFLQGPLVDAPGQTWTDPDGTAHPNRRRLGISNSMYYQGSSGPNGNPRSNSTDWYNYMQGIWKDGKPIVNCGNGYGPDSAGLACGATQKPTRFMWPGDPVTGTFWSETNIDGAGTMNTPSDRRFQMSIGPLTLASGSEQTIQFGIVWSQGGSHLNSVTRLREDVAEVRGHFQSDFTTRQPLMLPPGTPALVTPVDGATVAAGALQLLASIPSEQDRVEIQVVREAFTDTTRTYRNGSSVTVSPGTYLARVRYVAGPTMRGPWSDIATFSVSDVSLTPYTPGVLTSFDVVANAGGPISPPEAGAAPFAGFPTTSQLNPTDAQQVGPAMWLVYAGDGTGTYESFLSRSLREGNQGRLAGRTVEIRFTDAGSVGYRGLQDSAAVQLPFELWSSDSATLGDPSDDVKLIPLILDRDNDGTFNLSEPDSPVSSREDDPFTDWLYVYDPVDTAPGTAGYDAYANGGALDLSQVGGELFARLVFVSWNGGEAPPYDQALPETGTVFRIASAKESVLDAPVLLSPSDASSFERAPRLFWAEPDGIDGQVEIATDRSFRSPVAFKAVYGGGGTSSSATVDSIGAGSYFWRVILRSQSGDTVRSDVRTFSVSQTITANEADAMPQSLTLLSPEPHPVSGPSRLRFYLPQSADVRMEAYDLMGRRVAVLAEGSQSQGWREASWPEGLSAGVYLVRLRAGSETQTRQVVVVR